MPEINESLEQDLWKEMRNERAKEEAVKPATGKKFENLPDGDYVGRVFIQPDKVSGATSPNYGRSKYVLKLTVTTEGPFKGKMAYNHRVILPHYLATQPPAGAKEELEKWKGDVKNYFRMTDTILAKCGVDVSGDDRTLFAKRIAENNRRNPIVQFTMKGGQPYVNHLVNGQPDGDDFLFSDEEPPDGNDVQFK